MSATILAAYALDLVVGDPAGVPHPVIAIGRAIHAGERVVRPRLPASVRGERIGGALLTCTVVGGAAIVGALALATARRCGTRTGRAVEVIAAASTLATRDLLGEAATVRRALLAGDVALARTRVARIVGRDTATLDSAGVARAVIETLAESTCDGIVAPLFFLACGGVPAALAFKAASTLDSMIGHREAPYRFFGSFAARLDDVANLIPARVSALLIAAIAPVAGGSPLRALAVVAADARKHRSPNAGFPEAAIAGALGIRLGGALAYDGVPVDAAVLGASGRVPTVDDVSRAMRVCACVSLLAAVLASWVVRRA
jgi:adenosylcobinamide-phosphate synthase